MECNAGEEYGALLAVRPFTSDVNDVFTRHDSDLFAPDFDHSVAFLDEAADQVTSEIFDKTYREMGATDYHDLANSGRVLIAGDARIEDRLEEHGGRLERYTDDYDVAAVVLDQQIQVVEGPATAFLRPLDSVYRRFFGQK